MEMNKRKTKTYIEKLCQNKKLKYCRVLMIQNFEANYSRTINKYIYIYNNNNNDKNNNSSNNNNLQSLL